MSNYGTTAPYAIYPGDSVTLFSAEQPATPQASQAVAVGMNLVQSQQNLAVEGFFSGAPGVFELDVQTSDTDSDQYYQNVPGAGAITAVDANQHFRAELPNVVCKFARVRLASRANAVNLTVRISR